MDSYPLTLTDVSMTIRGTGPDGSPVEVEVFNADLKNGDAQIRSQEPRLGSYSNVEVPLATRYSLEIYAELLPAETNGPVFTIKVPPAIESEGAAIDRWIQRQKVDPPETDAEHIEEAVNTRCPLCGHQSHNSLGFCPNMASDNDCDCPGVVGAQVGPERRAEMILRDERAGVTFHELAPGELSNAQKLRVQREAEKVRDKALNELERRQKQRWWRR